jgi:hypothetical protein
MLETAENVDKTESMAAAFAQTLGCKYLDSHALRGSVRTNQVGEHLDPRSDGLH